MVRPDFAPKLPWLQSRGMKTWELGVKIAMDVVCFAVEWLEK